MQNATNFREYPRGRQLSAADWRIFGSSDPASFALNGVEIDPTRQQWLSGGVLVPFPTSGLGGLLWTAADGAGTGHGDQEVRVRVLLSGVDANVAIVRASGNAGNESGYILRVEPTFGNIKILKNLNGVVSTISSVTKPFTAATFAGFVLRVNGSTITARGWQEADGEPVGWDLTVTDTSIADGSLGLCTDAQPLAGDVFFFSYGTAGDAAPLESFIPAGIEEWASHEGDAAELTAEWEVFDPASGLLEKVFLSTAGRKTGPGDWPPNATFFPLLTDPGNLAIPLSGDDFAPQNTSPQTAGETPGVSIPGGQLAITLGNAAIRNPMIQLDGRLQRFLDFVMKRTMAGRRWTVRAGLRSWTSHRWFEPLYTGTLAGEPESGDTLTLTLADPYWRLQQTLKVARNIGIETCLTASGAGLISPVNAAYDLTSFTVMWRFIYNAGIPAVDSGFGKGLTPTNENFALFIEAHTGRMMARASCAGQAGAIKLRSAGIVLGPGWHTAVFAVDGTRTAYLLIDGMLVGPVIPPALVDLPSVGVNLCVNNAGHQLMDARVYNFCMEVEDALAATAARAAADDPGVLSMWRCDDALGAVITDYGPLANHVTITGTLGVNYSWTPSYQGQESSAGTPQPLSYGAVFNAPAPLIDDARPIFRMSDVDNSTLAMTIKARGLVLSPGSDYAVNANGTATMTGAQTEPVTCDIALGQQSSRLGAVLLDALVNRAGHTAETLDLDACTIIGQLLPYTVALYSAAEMTGGAFLDALLKPVGGHVRIDRDSRLSPGVLLPPITPGPYAGEPALEFSGLDRSRVLFDGDYGAVGTSGSFTFVLWVLTFSTEKYVEMDTDPNPNRQTLAMKGDGVTSGYQISLYQPLQGAVRLSLPGLSSATLVTPAGAVSWGVWTMIAGRYDQTAGTLTIFSRPKGGSLVLQVLATGVTGLLTVGTGALQLGGARGIGSVNGSVQHFQAWDSALSDAAIEALGVAHPVGTERGLNFYPWLIEGKGRTATDLVSTDTGTIYGCRWAPRLILDFRKSLTKSTFRTKKLRPAWDVKLTFAVNQAPMKDADIAGIGVTAAERSALKRANRTAPAASQAIKDDYLDARELLPVTALMNPSEAARLARNLRLRYDPKRIMARVEDAPRGALSLIPTDEVWIYHPDLPEEGAAARAVGYSPDFSRLRFAIDGWGHPLDPVAGDVLIDSEGDTLLVQGPGDTLRTG